MQPYVEMALAWPSSRFTIPFIMLCLLLSVPEAPLISKTMGAGLDAINVEWKRSLKTEE